MFQSLYVSPWIATVLVAAVSTLGCALWLRHRSFLVTWFVLFTLVTIADALRSGAFSPLQRSPWWDEKAAIAFVFLGDLRYFLLVERFASRPDTKPRDATTRGAWLAATAFTAIAPLVSVALIKAFPKPFAEPRWIFMGYEAVVIGVVGTIRLFMLPRRLAATTGAVRKWLLEVTQFELTFYALWLISDVIILRGADTGFLLRIVPNVMYYGLFLPFVAYHAPPEVVE